jgi:hypothetical protein
LLAERWKIESFDSITAACDQERPRPARNIRSIRNASATNFYSQTSHVL